MDRAQEQGFDGRKLSYVPFSWPSHHEATIDGEESCLRGRAKEIRSTNGAGGNEKKSLRASLATVDVPVHSLPAILPHGRVER